MTLNEALWILDRVHTRDDNLAMYVVDMHPILDVCAVSQKTYVQAWGVVRQHLRAPNYILTEGEQVENTHNQI